MFDTTKETKTEGKKHTSASIRAGNSIKKGKA
jgi:hypothetical protein